MNKSVFFSFASLGLVFGLTACSKSDSPTAPRPSPTPQAVSVSLTVSSTSAVAGQVVEARATVRQGSSAVPDGTVVNFTLPRQTCWDDKNQDNQQQPEELGLCYYFIDNRDASLAKSTQGGVASAAWTSGTAGDVTVSASVGSANDSKTVRFSPPPGPVEEVAGAPVVYSLVPNEGSWQGGEEVEIRGENLCVYRVVATGLCTSDAPTVRFGLGDPVAATYTAEVVYVSPDGRFLRVKTPRASVDPPAQDILTDVSVTNLTDSATLVKGFVYRGVIVREPPTPQLFALVPNSGPIEGGTRVTILGSGFDYPVQVLFGDREAQVISSNFNEIVCIAPSIAPSQPETPTTVDVSVKNVLTGKTSSNTLPYRYGEAMFISAIQPNTGYILGWNPATIYGQGFVAPVQVEVTAGGLTKQAEVLSVSGTSIQVKMPPFAELAGGDQGCTPVAATFKVTNIGSNLSATGPVYTYLCSGGISGP